MRRIIVAVFRLRQFTKSRPGQAQRKDPALGKIDATLLLVFRGVTGNFVADDIENAGRLAPDLLWSVQDRRGVEAGNNFISQLAQSVSLVGFNNVDLLKPGRGVDPFSRPTMKSYVLENVIPNPFLLR